MPRSFEFDCPSCAARGRAHEEWAGRSVRCKHCKATFQLPSSGEPLSDSYALAEPIGSYPASAPQASSSLDEAQTTYISSYRDATLEDRDRLRQRPTHLQRHRPREEFAALAGDRRFQVLTGIAGIAGLLTALVFLIPGFGLIGGAIMMVIGFVLVATGYFVGACAAFQEDFLYGMAYIFIPIFLGYYLVSRFEDLWPWFTTSTIGFGLSLFGKMAIERSGGF